MQPTRTLLDDGRWHFQYGPIDLVISADGDAAAIHDAVESSWRRFAEILPELVAELSLLRQPLQQSIQQTMSVQGAVARRMVAACWPHRAQFITPMAAVAGAVADEMLTFYSREPGVTRASINNGGDIALHLQQGQSYHVGLVTDIAQYAGMPNGSFMIDASMPVGGIATSGWRGRSLSLGIADSVTVLAKNAAAADAAATMIANAVNAEHAAIQRAPASSIKDDSDLGSLLVTTAVGVLPHALVAQVLQQGVMLAQRLMNDGVIYAAVLTLQAQSRAAGLSQRCLTAPLKRAA
jgi:ApbE superfamily uncharacterized protein (UPF0280 family)